MREHRDRATQEVSLIGDTHKSEKREEKEGGRGSNYGIVRFG
jgi:hypothetical protein